MQFRSQSGWPVRSWKLCSNILLFMDQQFSANIVYYTVEHGYGPIWRFHGGHASIFVCPGTSACASLVVPQYFICNDFCRKRPHGNCESKYRSFSYLTFQCHKKSYGHCSRTSFLLVFAFFHPLFKHNTVGSILIIPRDIVLNVMYTFNIWNTHLISEISLHLIFKNHC